MRRLDNRIAMKSLSDIQVQKKSEQDCQVNKEYKTIWTRNYFEASFWVSSFVDLFFVCFIVRPGVNFTNIL